MNTVNRLLLESSRAARQAASLYFQPFRVPWARVSKELVGTSASNKYTDSGALLGLMKNAACFNQGATIEYMFSTAERHKLLKSAFVQSNKRVDEIERRTQDLLNFLNRKFYEICFKNFEFSRSYFSLRSAAPPRICLKGNFPTGVQQRVVSIFRDQEVEYNSDVKIEGNTGFNSIKQNGKYFLENNIPEAVALRDYRNPRLNRTEIDADFRRHGDVGLISRGWDRYWKEFESEKRDDTSFYRSTLIIPLTLWNNDLSEEFESLVNRKMTSDDKIDRLIFGYLCFDHRQENYFDEVNDVAFGYVIADLLSVFAFTRLVYTDFSNTYRDAEKFLGSASVLEKLQDVFEDIPVFADRKVQDHLTTLNPIATSRNKLLPVDELLLRYARRGWRNKTAKSDTSD